MNLPWVSRLEYERVLQQNRTLQAQLELMHALVADYRAIENTRHGHTGQLLAMTADHARLQTTTDHLAQLLTLNQHEKAVMLQRIAGMQLPTPDFAVQHSAPPSPFETGSPGSVVMPTIPGDIAPGVPAVAGRNAIGDAINRIRDERDAQREGKGQGTGQAPGIFDDLGDTAEEIERNEQRLSAP